LIHERIALLVSANDRCPAVHVRRGNSIHGARSHVRQITAIGLSPIDLVLRGYDAANSAPSGSMPVYSCRRRLLTNAFGTSSLCGALTRYRKSRMSFAVATWQGRDRFERSSQAVRQVFIHRRCSGVAETGRRSAPLYMSGKIPLCFFLVRLSVNACARSYPFLSEFVRFYALFHVESNVPSTPLFVLRSSRA
jgi:hypothetical protein